MAKIKSFINSNRLKKFLSDNSIAKLNSYINMFDLSDESLNEFPTEEDM
jgi:hypothetical protein